jgi:hypothetical protein
MAVPRRAAAPSLFIKEILQSFLKSCIFLAGKMEKNRKMPTEKEIIEQLRRGKVSLLPLQFRFLEGQPDQAGKRRFDALVEATWQKSKARFAVQCKSISTPKAFQNGVNLLRSSQFPKGYRPMLIMPFLSQAQLQELEREGISGIDLCGNGVVIAQNKFGVFRSGETNRFPSSAPIKNVYRKNSSMVGRVFLIRPGYDTVQEICSEINRRNILVNRWDKGPMSLSTVSKSLKILEEDLIVGRNAIIRLLQPEKLLEKLTENYVPPKIKERVRLKVPDETGSIQELLRKQAQKLGLPLVATGASSVAQFAVMQRGDTLSVYCPRLDTLAARLPGSRGDRFPNLELLETEDETVYFDAREKGGFWWASPVQVYLGLMSGDKRDRDTAEQVKSFLLTNLKQTKP